MEKHIINTITAEIILGKPSEGCQGHGICRVMTESKSNGFKCPSVTTVISITPDQKLRFSFLKSSLNAKAIEQHFGNSWFRMEEPMSLPPALQARFQFSRKIIQPGDYPITENDHFFIVTC